MPLDVLKDRQEVDTDAPPLVCQVNQLVEISQRRRQYPPSLGVHRRNLPGDTGLKSEGGGAQIFGEAAPSGEILQMSALGVTEPDAHLPDTGSR